MSYNHNTSHIQLPVPLLKSGTDHCYIWQTANYGIQMYKSVLVFLLTGKTTCIYFSNIFLLFDYPTI